MHGISSGSRTQARTQARTQGARGRWLPLLVLLVSLLVPGAARSASRDPDFTWHSLQTEHFTITFHQGEERLAREMATLGERVWARVSSDLETTVPRRVELVLVDHTDSANGYATRLPVNTIVIYVTAPQEDSTLNLYTEWNEAILTHELTHILHLDHVGGLPRVLRLVLGRIVSVNELSPRWFVEGLAVYEETERTEGGRGRSAQVDMIERMVVLEGKFPPLGNLDGFQSDPPYGNLRYLFGHDFVDYIARTRGEDVLAEYVHTYGRWVLPYLFPTRKVFGATFRQLYDEWKAEMIARYEEQGRRIRARGLTRSRLVSDGESACSSPRFSPDGERLVYACNSRTSGPSVRVADGRGEGARILFRDERAARNFAWNEAGTGFYYAREDVWDQYYLFYDLYFHDLEQARSWRFTDGARVRDPELSPDGHALWAVANHRQNNDLVRYAVTPRTPYTREPVRQREPGPPMVRTDGSHAQALTHNRDHTQYSTPRFHPGGQWVALSAWKDGTRDLWIYDRRGRPRWQITSDPAIDRDPAWSPDGRYLFFSSDRDGVPNLYALDLAIERLYRVTNVLGGAFQPHVHPDGSSLAYAEFTHNGTDIRILDLVRSTWADLGSLPAPDAVAPLLASARGVPEPGREPGAAGAGRPPPPLGSCRTALTSCLRPPPPPPGVPQPQSARTEADSPASSPTTGATGSDPRPPSLDVPDPPESSSSAEITPYRPLSTLLPPRYVLPSVYIADYGALGVLSTSGSDILDHYLYNVYGTLRSDNLFVGGGATLVLNRWHPVFSLGGRISAVRYGRVYEETRPPDEGGAHVPGIERGEAIYYDRRTRLWSQVTWPVARYHNLFVQYDGTHRTNLDDLPDETYLPYLPTRGFLSTMGGGWRYSHKERYTYSISPERGRVVSVVGETTSSVLGSYTLDETGGAQPFDQYQITGEWREYLAVPWLDNHVLALRGATGLSWGDRLTYGSFRLGGSYGEGSVYVLPDEYRSLRGFPVAAVYGDAYYLAAAEYRFPIWRIDRGWGTIPFFLQTLHGAVFTDMGNAFDVGASPASEIAGGTLVGTGAELRLGMVVGWGFSLTARLGWAFAVHGEGGYAPGSTEGLYGQFGTSF